VVRGTLKSTIQDLLLLNDGTGRNFTSVQLPSVQPGMGGSAIPIDYDRNGRMDLVVLHGNNQEEGPVQLLAFGPPWPIGPAPTPTPEPSATPGPGTPAPTQTPPAETAAPTAAVATPTSEPTQAGTVGPPTGSARPPAVASPGGAITLGALGLAALLLFGFQARRRGGPV
jgi:hypothetical protein